MNNVVITLICVVFAAIIPLAFYLRERQARKDAEKHLDVVRVINILDTRIFRMKMDDAVDWPTSPEAQMLIAKRIEYHEKLASFLRNHPLRDIEYMKELMGFVIKKTSHLAVAWASATPAKAIGSDPLEGDDNVNDRSRG